MGLTERHLKQFHGQRIFSTVLVENLPQLFIQIWYLFAREEFDLVAVLAFISSVSSVFFALIDVYSSLTLTSAMKLAINNDELQIEGYGFDLVGKTVIDNRSLFKIRPNAMRKLFAKLVVVDSRNVECNHVLKTEQGLQYGFSVLSMTNKRKFKSKAAQSSERMQRLVYIYVHSIDLNSFFLQEIVQTWKLNTLVKDINQLDIRVKDIVTFYDFEIRDTKTIFDHDSRVLKESGFYKSNKHLFTFEKIGLFQTVCIASENGDKNDEHLQDNISDDPMATPVKENVEADFKTSISFDNESNLVNLQHDMGIDSQDNKSCDNNDLGVDVVVNEQVGGSDHNKRIFQVSMMGMIREQINEEMNGGIALKRLIPLRRAHSDDTVHRGAKFNSEDERGVSEILSVRSLSRSVTTPT